MFYLLQYFFEILSGCFFLFLDYIIVSVLLIIRNNSEMSFIQEGGHTIRFHVSYIFFYSRTPRKKVDQGEQFNW